MLNEALVKKWEKIEDSINNVLEKSFSNVESVVKSTTPQSVRSWKKRAGDFLGHSKDQILSAPLATLGKFQQLKSSAIQNVEELKVNLNKNLNSAKQGKYSRFGALAALIAFIEWALMPFYKKIAAFFASMQPTTLASGIILLTVGSITGIGVYNSTQQIAEEAGIVERVPAAIERPSEVRPKYYKRNEKELVIANVIVPAYIEDKTDLKKLQVDFTIISSNRYIREYFFDNSYLIEDVFNSRIEPMIPGFPLGDEGKQILKEKIKLELNTLLNEMKIKGEIENVYISSLLAV